MNLIDLEHPGFCIPDVPLHSTAEHRRLQTALWANSVADAGQQACYSHLEYAGKVPPQPLKKPVSR